MSDPVTFRRIRDDEFDALTELLHRAYAPLAARGLRYVATHQDARTTRHRCEQGECWVGETTAGLVASVTWCRPDPASECAYYRRPEVARFGQYAVEPGLQRGGLGGALLDLVERRAAEEGFAVLACDTAKPAEHLVAWYARRGFAPVDSVRWRSVNYESVVLAKPLLR